MNVVCWHCERPICQLPDGAGFRGIAICPECVAERLLDPERHPLAAHVARNLERFQGGQVLRLEADLSSDQNGKCVELTLLPVAVETELR